MKDRCLGGLVTTVTAALLILGSSCPSDWLAAVDRRHVVTAVSVAGFVGSDLDQLGNSSAPDCGVPVSGCPTDFVDFGIMMSLAYGAIWTDSSLFPACEQGSFEQSFG